MMTSRDVMGQFWQRETVFELRGPIEIKTNPQEDVSTFKPGHRYSDSRRLLA
jgi:hypothetical protein